jgi:hypothetical protein
MSQSKSGLLDLVFRGGRGAFLKGKRISYFWHQSGVFFEWGRSELHELSNWICLQSKVLKYLYRILKTVGYAIYLSLTLKKERL